MSVTFTSGSTVLILPSPDYPEDPGDKLKQHISGTMGGRITAVTFSSGTIDSPVLHFTDLDETQYNALVSFINVTVVGAMNPFSYTDWESTTVTVKYIGGLPGKQVEHEHWVIHLSLRVVVT